MAQNCEKRYNNRYNKTIATATIRIIMTVTIVVYKGLISVVYRMLTCFLHLMKQ